MSEINKELALKLIDAIIEWHDWIPQEKVGQHEYYFSKHCLHIDVIEQFFFDQDFIIKFPELIKFLKEEIKQEMEETSTDEDVFSKWLRGGTYFLEFNGYSQILSKQLTKIYRERITTEYPCKDCDRLVSEKYSYSHPNSLKRIGYPEKTVKDGHGFVDFEKSIYKFVILCKSCHDNRTKIKKKE